MCSDAHVYNQLCKQFRKALGLTYQLTNYKPDYFNDNDCGLLLDTVVVTTVVLSNSLVYGFKFSTVSSFFDLWSLRYQQPREYMGAERASHWCTRLCFFFSVLQMSLNSATNGMGFFAIIFPDYLFLSISSGSYLRRIHEKETRRC